MMELLACGLQILCQICHTSNILQLSAVLSMVPTASHTQEPNDICIINEPWPSAMDDVLLSSEIIGCFIIDVACQQAVRDGAGVHWNCGQLLKQCITFHTGI